jgi:hypothetical protein
MPDADSADAYFMAGDSNLYRYVGNNTISRIDPSGLFWDWDGAFGGLIEGGIVGGAIGGTGGAVGGAIFGPGALITGGIGAGGGSVIGGIWGFFAGGLGKGNKVVAGGAAICGFIAAVAAPFIAPALGGSAVGGGTAGGGSAGGGGIDILIDVNEFIDTVIEGGAFGDTVIIPKFPPIPL